MRVTQAYLRISVKNIDTTVQGEAVRLYSQKYYQEMAEIFNQNIEESIFGKDPIKKSQKFKEI